MLIAHMKWTVNILNVCFFKFKVISLLLLSDLFWMKPVLFKWWLDVWGRFNTFWYGHELYLTIYFIVLVSSCFLNTYLFYWIVSIIFVPLFQPLILICHSYFNACVRSILNQETTDHTNDVTCYLLC